MKEKVNENVVEPSVKLVEDSAKVLVRRDVNFSQDSEKVYSHYLVDIECKTFNDRTKKIEWAPDTIKLSVARNDIDMYKVLKMIFLGDTHRELFKIIKSTTDFVGKKKTSVSYELRSLDGSLKAILVPDSPANATLLDYVFTNLVDKVETEEEIEEIKE